MERNRAKGVLIAGIAVACVTPDAMLLRWARVEGASPWQTAFFKMNIIGICNLGSALYLVGGPRALMKGIRTDPLALGAASLLQVGDQLGFTFSFLTTDTAQAMLFISLNPVWAALLGYFVLGDELPRRTIGLLAAGLASTIIVFMPSVLPSPDVTPAHEAAHTPASVHTPHQAATMHGAIISLGTGLCLASYVTFIRYCAKYRPAAVIDLAPSFGNVLAAQTALVMSVLLGNGPTRGIDMQGFAPVVVVNALLVAIFYVGFTLAPRYITGAEVALILLMETVCGPLWVFCRFGDVPSLWTVSGGALLVIALAVHEILGMCWTSGAPNGKSSPVVRLSSSPALAPLGKASQVQTAPSGESWGGNYHCFADKPSSSANC